MSTFSYILCFLWSFLIALFAIPSVRNLAFKKRLLDEPNSRSMHESSTPRLGGLAIFAGFLSSVTLFGTVNAPIQCMLSGAILIFFIGLKDDILPVSPVKKFFVQILSTSILLFIGDIRITSFHDFLSIQTLNPGISYFFTAIVIIGITNSINLIDGLDGLAGTVIMFIAFAFGIVFYILGKHPLVSLSICLAGATLGFLRYNFHKADIFMGDGGALTAGFILSFLAINFIESKPCVSSIPLVISILFIPILDTSRVFALRILDGKSPFIPDKNHLHHVLSRVGLSQKSIIVILILSNLLLIVAVWFLKDLGNNILIFSEIALAGILIVLLKIIEKKS